MKYNIMEMIESCLPELKDEYKFNLEYDIYHGWIELDIQCKKTDKIYWFVETFRFKEYYAVLEYIDFEIPEKYLKEK